MSSCGTYAGAGATTGGWFGSIIGSAIGGIAGGPRGSDIGTLVGLAGGAVVGAAIGQAADNAEQKRYEEYRAQRSERVQRSERSQTYQEPMDSQTNGDDRIYGFDENFNSIDTENISENPTMPVLEIRNPRIIDSSRDGVLTRGEEARMVFEVFNISSKPVFRVLPTVAEVTGNKHVRVSENVMVESVMPGKGIRYTAVIRTDDRLRDGEAIFRISVFQGNREISSQAREFRIVTSKR